MWRWSKQSVSLSALITGAGERAGWRFLEFFTVNIRNPNTRAAIGKTGKLEIAQPWL